MSDVPKSVVVLLLVDNTANMARSNEKGIPYLSFAKVAITNTKTELDRLKAKTTLMVAIANASGDPVVYTYDQQRMDDFRVCQLDISPCGSFQEVVTEGLGMLNRSRTESQRDINEPFFFTKFTDSYFIIILTDVAALDGNIFSGFDQTTQQRLLHPDERCFFIDYVYQETPPNREIIDRIRADYYHCRVPYDVLSVTRVLSQPRPWFQFFIDFGLDTLMYCYIDFTNSRTQWPIPDQRNSSNLFPVYTAQSIENPPKSHNFTFHSFTSKEFMIKSSEGSVGPGIYMISSDSIPFACMELGPEPSFTLLPYNFPDFYNLLAVLPSREKCDQYLRSIPNCYQEPTKTQFKSLKLSFSNDTARRPHQMPGMYQMNPGQPNDYMKNRPQPAFTGVFDLLRVTRNDSALSVLIEDVPEFQHTLAATVKDTMIVNLDTADDIKWTSILPYVERQTPFLQSYYQRFPLQGPLDTLEKYKAVESKPAPAPAHKSESKPAPVAVTKVVEPSFFHQESAPTTIIALAECVTSCVRRRDMCKLQQILLNVEKHDKTMYQSLVVLLHEQAVRFCIPLPDSFQDSNITVTSGPPTDAVYWPGT